MILDEHLTWIPHITNVARKVSKPVGVMYKASFCLCKRSLITLYYFLLYPYLQYCVSVWGSTYPSNLNRIFMLQKRAVRIIAKESFDAHTDPIFKNLKILKFNCTIMYTMCPPGCYHNGFMATPELGHRMYGYTLLDCIVESQEKFNCIYLFQLGKLMFQFKNGLLPRTFDSKFALNSQVHNYDTRNSKLFHIPKIRTNICKFSLRYQGPRFYNSLSSDIQSARTMTSFVNGLKTSLIDF